MGWGFQGAIRKAFPEGQVALKFCWIHLDRALDRNMNKNKAALYAAKALKHCTSPAMFHMMYQDFIRRYGGTNEGKYFIGCYGTSGKVHNALFYEVYAKS